jgi:hypothetical protein
MADATDLKSVGLKRPVPVRVRPSAPLNASSGIAVAGRYFKGKVPVMLKARLFLAIFLGVVSTSVYAGIYQRTRRTHVLVWNDHPTSFQEVTWSGGKDPSGYATGYGTLTWYAPEKPPLTGSSIPSRRRMIVVRSESGTMERGRFVNPPKGRTPKPAERTQRPEGSSAPVPERAAKTPSAPPKEPSPAARPSSSTTATPEPSAPTPAPTPSPTPQSDSINSLTRPPSSLQLSSPTEAPAARPTESPSPSP